jgi:hypothetical protein
MAVVAVAQRAARCASTALLVVLCCIIPTVAAQETEAALLAMSHGDLVQYALQLQNVYSAPCDSCSPGNPCENGGTCYPQHATGFVNNRTGHRLRRVLQAAPAPAPCSTATMASRTAAINAKCCKEDGAACDAGTLTSCDAECAAVFLPFWHDCGEVLQQYPGGSDQLSVVVAECESQVAALPSTRQFTCECTAGWRGELCEQATGCDGQPCGAHGACAAFDGSSYACTCDAGWSGPRCDVNQCSLPYLTVSDSWRSTGHGADNRGDNQLGDPQCPNGERNGSR